MPDINAIRYFQAQLSYETSPREVVSAIKAGDKIVLIDVRRPESYAKGHVPGALNFPVDTLDTHRPDLDHAATLIVYDWGPASTESTRACLALLAQDYRVREMQGGYEYWNRLGLGVEDSTGVERHRVADPLTTSNAIGWD